MKIIIILIILSFTIPVYADPIHIMFGIDSLTSGAGGSAYVDYLKPHLYKAYGNGGYLTSIGWAESLALGASFSMSGFEHISTLPKTTSPAIYSFDFQGMHTDHFTSGKYIAWDPQGDYSAIDIYYLQQPGGGSFAYGDISVPVGLMPVKDTNGPLSLQKVTVKNKTVVISHSKDGILTVFGLFVKANSGVIITRQAQGGLKLSDFAGLDSDFQRAWYNSLAPDLYFLNAGMNDRSTSTPAVYSANMDTFIGRLNSGCSPILIAPNETDYDELSYLPGYRTALYEKSMALDYGFINIVDIFGRYSQAVDRLLMLDCVHPNANGNRLIAKGVCGYMGIDCSDFEDFKLNLKILTSYSVDLNSDKKIGLIETIYSLQRCR